MPTPGLLDLGSQSSTSQRGAPDPLPSPHPSSPPAGPGSGSRGFPSPYPSPPPLASEATFASGSLLLNRLGTTDFLFALLRYSAKRHSPAALHHEPRAQLSSTNTASDGPGVPVMPVPLESGPLQQTAQTMSLLEEIEWSRQQPLHPSAAPIAGRERELFDTRVMASILARFPKGLSNLRDKAVIQFLANDVTSRTSPALVSFHQNQLQSSGPLSPTIAVPNSPVISPAAAYQQTLPQEPTTFLTQAELHESAQLQPRLAASLPHANDGL